jgi:serine/threonine protein kinase
VGTYSQSRSFSMLLYPVADQHLGEYLDNMEKLDRSDPDSCHKEHMISLSESSVCLVSALRYIHLHGIKHMDIKPQNILVENAAGLGSSNTQLHKKKMFLCDFGIAHLFESQDASKTDSYFGRTPKYAAPEVACNEVHGRTADIFSLGCVFAEMNTVFSTLPLSDFDEYRLDDSNAKPYNETIPRCQTWLERLENMEISTATVALMMEKDPSQRPRLKGPKHHIGSQAKSLNALAESMDARPDSSPTELRIITQFCAHKSDGPEPYVYDKSYIQ